MTPPDSPRTEESPRHSRAIPVALLSLCLILAAAGVLFISSGSSVIGIGALAASFLTLLLLLRSLDGRARTEVETGLFAVIDRHVHDPVGVGLVALGMGASLVATWRSRAPATADWLSFGLWLAGVLAMSAFAVRSARSSREDSRVVPFSRVEIAGIAAVTIAAFVVRFIRLTDVPYPMSGDEASIGLEGEQILAGSSRDMFRTGWSSQPILSFLGPAVSMALFGTSLVGLRLFPVLTGTLTVPVLYLLVRVMFSRAPAFLAAFLLASMSFHVHFSRIAVNNADAAFVVCLVASMLYAIARSRRAHWYVAAGLATGFGLYSFAGARLVFVFAFLFLAYLGASDRGFRADWPKLLLFAAAMWVVVLPTAVHFLEHPDVGFGRLNQVGVVPSGWLDREAARTGTPAAFVLVRQILRSFAIVVSSPAAEGFYNSPKPLLDLLWTIAFLIGLMFSWIRPFDPRHVLLNIWFWSVIVFGGAFVLPPPAAERFLLAAPAVAVFAALGVWSVWSLVGRIWRNQRLATGGAFATGILMALSSLTFYFGEYTRGYYFTDTNSEVGTELGRYLALSPRGAYVYFTGLPRMWYGSIPSSVFLSRGLPGEDFPSGTVPSIDPSKRPVHFVFLPHLSGDLARIRSAYPGGRTLTVWRRPKPTEPLFYVYRLD
jgi:Dolichyl-phosphate-mannose-protein mannosyltransferase